MSKQVRFDANKTASENNFTEKYEPQVNKTQSLDSMAENMYIGDVHPSTATTDLYQSGDMPVPMPSASKKNPSDSSGCWFYHNSLPEDVSKSAKALRASKLTHGQTMTAERQKNDTVEDQQRTRNPAMQSSQNFLGYNAQTTDASRYGKSAKALKAARLHPNRIAQEMATESPPFVQHKQNPSMQSGQGFLAHDAPPADATNSRYGKSAKALKASRLHPNNIAQKLAADTQYFDTREDQQRNNAKSSSQSSMNFLAHDSLPEDASRSRIEMKKRHRENQYKFEPKSPIVAAKNSHECIFGTSNDTAYKPGKKVFPEKKPEPVVPPKPTEVKKNYRRQMAGSSMSFVMGGDQ